MKKALMILGMISCLVCSACSTNKEDNKDQEIQKYTNYYKPCVEKIIQDLSDGEQSDHRGENAIFEIYTNHGKDLNYALNHMGYVLQDISGDGIPELCIYYQDDVDQTISRLLTVYAYDENQPCVNVFDSWAATPYYYLQDGSIYHAFALGKQTIAFGTYWLSHNGQELSTREVYISKQIGDTKLYYMSDQNEIDLDSCTLLDWDEDRFDREMERWSLSILDVDFTPFENFTKDHILIYPSIKPQKSKHIFGFDDLKEKDKKNESEEKEQTKTEKK